VTVEVGDMLKKLGQRIGLIDDVELGDMYRYQEWDWPSVGLYKQMLVILSKKKLFVNQQCGDDIHWKGYECHSILVWDDGHIKHRIETIGRNELKFNFTKVTE